MVRMIYPGIDTDTSEKIWLLKAFAIIAVVTCHCTHTIENPGKINVFATYFFATWQGMGVPIFYLCSGFFFKANENILIFIKNKVVSVVLPWICTGTAVWLYIVLRKGGISFYNWADYLFLRGSYLYFLTNLIIFYFIMYVAQKRKYIYYFICVYTVLSCIAMNLAGGDIKTALMMPYTVLGVPFIYWFYFSLGTIIRQFSLFKFVDNSRLSWLILVFVFLAIIDKMNIGTEKFPFVIDLTKSLSLIIGLYNLRDLLTKLRIKDLLINVGKVSFSIYLLHMPFAGIIANMLNKSEAFAILTFVRPLMVIAITIFVIEAYKKIVRNNKYMLRLIGIRN